MTFVKFNKYPQLEDKHAFLSASKPHWVNYDPEKLLDKMDQSMDAALGTRLHKLAKELIELGMKMPNNSITFNAYVNECIGYKMTPEQTLFYSEYAFGTADAISFSNRVLRIFDLKNGVTKVNGNQLKMYAALFCLEYKTPPASIEYDLRIFQNDEIFQIEVTVDEVIFLMDRYREADELIRTREV